MSATELHDASPPAAQGLSREEARVAARALNRRRLVAFLLVAPLLAFVIFAFFAPVATMLHRSVHNPTVVELIPGTLELLQGWSGEGTPPDAVLTSMAVDLKRLAQERTSGKLAEELNRGLPGTSSVVKSTARKMRRADDAELQANGAALLLAAHDKWAEPLLWSTLREVGRSYSERNFLTALDLEKDPEGGIRQRESARIYIQLYGKTLKIAVIITVLTLLLGYPLAYVITGMSAKVAGIMLIFVLLPFWTSLLVRTTSWIALLQTNGVVNSFLMGVGLTGEPFEMMYTEFATIVAMTHILLPFMVLPLYSVMRGIDPSYVRAALSLGSGPIAAFIRVYFPMTLPGLSAGALLVFIISVGYYITPALVGGTDGQMISNIIAFHMQQSNNWELAAALGTLLLFLIIVLYWVYDRLVGAKNIKLG
ncbi:MAG: ABC transporter permease [Chloroflexota bacterium]|nr:ABC transporter permease [Chloroflexota bacterium]